jgi:hypothetical protein
MTVLIGFLGVIFGTLVGAIATYVTTRSNMLLEIQHSYDRVLIDKRLERYQALFHVSKCLPSYWVPGEEPIYEDLRQLRQDLTDWYFGDAAGGMFLSPAAKEHFMRLLTTVVEVVHERTEDHEGIYLSRAQSQKLRECASELRHQLAEDVGASNPPRLRWPRLDPVRFPPSVGTFDSTANNYAPDQVFHK